jgi:hypothetical protein
LSKVAQTLLRTTTRSVLRINRIQPLAKFNFSNDLTQKTENLKKLLEDEVQYE